MASVTGEPYLTGRANVAGARLSSGVTMNRRLVYEITGDAEYRDVVSGSTGTGWRFPVAAASLGTRISGDFIGDRLHAILFQHSRFLYYDAPAGLAPDGGYLLIDAGVTFRVRTVELFYTIENLTGEELLWFDALASLDRNGMWGCRWVFDN